jgi:sarcosine oxidase
MRKRFDVIVLGLGAIGSAATYHLAKLGNAVLGLDQLSPPHTKGSTHGESRITRLAIGEGPEYTPLAMRSHQLWRDLERETGAELLFPCGGLIISNHKRKPPSHGVDDFFCRTLAAARQYGIEHEVLAAKDICKRFPQFNVEDHEFGYYEPTAGYLLVEACVAAHLELAKEKYGAELRVNEKVRSFELSGNRIVLTTENGRSYRADRLLIAAGAWLPGLLGDPLARLFTVTRQVQIWFEVKSHAPSFAPGTFPIFIWEQPDKDQPIYGSPAVSGPAAGIKIATEGKYRVDPDAVDRTEPPDRIRAMYETYVKSHFRYIGPRALRTAVCLYTEVAGGRFVVDRHPESSRITFASACSGHGFKHSAALGEALAQMLTTGNIDLRPFSIAELLARNAPAVPLSALVSS